MTNQFLKQLADAATTRERDDRVAALKREHEILGGERAIGLNADDYAQLFAESDLCDDLGSAETAQREQSKHMAALEAEYVAVGGEAALGISCSEYCRMFAGWDSK